jgi:hypothetical protein
VPTQTAKLRLPAVAGEWAIVKRDVGAQPPRITLTQPGAQHVSPAIGGDTVIWQEFLTDQYGSHWGIRGVNPAGFFTVVSAEGDQLAPSLDEDTVYYLDNKPAAGRAVRKRRLGGSNEDQALTPYGYRVSPPHARHGHVVWDEGVGDPIGSDIYGDVCASAFRDVPPTAYFSESVLALACRGVVSGYGDGTFRPYAPTTRAQLTKMVVLGEAWWIDLTGGPSFADVPANHPFYPFIQTAYNRGIISGYAGRMFRPAANVTRGQLAKIIVIARGWPIDTGGGPHFTDVPPTHPFYPFIETAYNRGVVSGYAGGTFRVGANATRGQIAKIVWGALQQP